MTSSSCRLVCDRSERLGTAGISDFKKHPFFSDINWDHLPQMSPPYRPEFSSPTDTSNFDTDDMDQKPTGDDHSRPPPRAPHTAFSGNHLPFIGFTYTSNS